MDLDAMKLEMDGLRSEIATLQETVSKAAETGAAEKDELQKALDAKTDRVSELEQQIAEAAPPAPPVPVEPAEGEVAKELSRVNGELAKAQEEIARLKAPVRGGLLNTAIVEMVDPLDGAGRIRPLQDLLKEADATRGLSGGEYQRRMHDIQRRANNLVAGSMLAEHGFQPDDLAKAAVEGYDFSAGNLQQILLPDAISIWGAYKTPLLNRIGSERAVDITDRWEDQQVAAPAENKQVEGIMASALTGVVVLPVVRTNTCQIVSRLIEATGSAVRAARNGVYGRSLMDIMANQMRVQMPTLVADIEYSAWFTVEVTQASGGDAMASARAMAGYVGAVGTFTNGQFTTGKGSTVTNLAGAELDEASFKTWLRAIALACQSPMDLPTAIYCPLVFQDKLAGFEYTLPAFQTAQGGSPVITAGVQVNQYRAPWGADIHIVWEPQNSYSATAGNNWIAAVCEPNCAMRNLAGSASEGGFDVINLPALGDRVQAQVLWEGCNRAQVYAGMGLMYNFTCTL